VIVAYIAHPLGAGPDRERNRANAARWVAWIARTHNVAPIADWIVLSGEWEETAENRERGLAIDLELVERCDAIFLVGGRVSPGMQQELHHAVLHGLKVFDLTAMGYEAPTGAIDVAGGAS
jgi:hypothetical protein